MNDLRFYAVYKVRVITSQDCCFELSMLSELVLSMYPAHRSSASGTCRAQNKYFQNLSLFQPWNGLENTIQSKVNYYYFYCTTLALNLANQE